MTQIELNKALDGVTDCSDSLSGEQVLGISTNSKEIIPGFIFVAIRGTNFDGNDFIDEALDRGAICAITDSMLPNHTIALALKPNLFLGLYFS